MTASGPETSSPPADGIRANRESAEASDPRVEARAGVGFGVAAYAWWGLVPIYFKAVAYIPAFEVLAYRIVWSVCLLVLLLRVKRRLRTVSAVLRDKRTFLTLLGTTALIALNWFVFIWAVANEQVLQASLGYFINPRGNSS